MKPYYEDNQVTIYNANCLDVLPIMSKVDLILTDPPYGIGKDYNTYVDDINNHKNMVKKWHKAMSLVSDKICLSPGIWNMWDWPKPDWVICWHKNFSVSKCLLGANNWEPVFYYGKGTRGERQSDYFNATFIHDAIGADHPCPKPLKFFTNLIKIVGKNTKSILDPFLGSGTSLRAAKNFNIKGIGIEMDEKYCEIAATRMSQEVLEL